MKNLGRSLNEAEFKELEEFLVSDATPEGCMDISSLDGFLTAVVIGPVTLTPSQWLPTVWGETEDDEMIWDSMEQMERITALIMRLLNSIATVFLKAPGSFEPRLYTREVEGEKVGILDDWCYGFMQEFLLRPKAWAPILATDKDAATMMVMMLYGTELGLDKLKEEGGSLDEHNKYVSLLAPSVRGVFDFWLARRAPPVPVASAKFGRNEPCPCGSGKKFKKCCG